MWRSPSNVDPRRYRAEVLVRTGRESRSRPAPRAASARRQRRGRSRDRGNIAINGGPAPAVPVVRAANRGSGWPGGRRAGRLRRSACELGHISDKDLMIVPAFVLQIRVSTDGGRVIKPYGAGLDPSPGIRANRTHENLHWPGTEAFPTISGFPHRDPVCFHLAHLAREGHSRVPAWLLSPQTHWSHCWAPRSMESW